MFIIGSVMLQYTRNTGSMATMSAVDCTVGVREHRWLYNDQY